MDGFMINRADSCSACGKPGSPELVDGPLRPLDSAPPAGRGAASRSAPPPLGLSRARLLEMRLGVHTKVNTHQDLLVSHY